MEEKSPGILPTEVGSHSGLVSVTTSPSPLKQTRVETFAEIGQTVAEMLAAAGYPFGNDAYHSIVLVNGEELSEEQALTYRPKVGEYVTASIVPHGGKTGKAILGVLIGILMIASGVGAAGIPGVLQVVGGYAAIVSGVLSLVAPPQQQPFSGDIPTSQKSRAISGVRNDLRPYDVIPSVLGKHRMFPPFLAQPFTELIANQQHLRVLLTFGYGPLEITDLKIGETSFADAGLVEGTHYKIHEGFTDDDDLSIFTDDVTELGLGYTLVERNTGTFVSEYGNWGGHETMATESTEPNTVEANIEMTFPAGLIAFRDDTNFLGEPRTVTIFFRIEFRLKDAEEDDPWTQVDASHGAPDRFEFGNGVRTCDEWGANIEMRGDTRGKLTIGLHWTFPAQGQYDVRIRRTNTRVGNYTRQSPYGSPYDSPPNEFRYISEPFAEESVWTKLRSIKPYAGSTIPNLCKLEMKIQATDKRSGMLDSVNGVAQSWVNKYDNTNGWGSRTLLKADKNVSLFLTRNPAWIFAHVLRGHQNTRPITDEQIDSGSIALWASDCSDGSGVLGGAGKARTFDAIVDFPLTVRRLLDDIAGSSRASFNIVDGKYGVVVDRPMTNIIQHFTPRNSNSFSGSKTFRKRPHAMKVNFISPPSYKPDEILVYNNGFSKDGNKSVHLEFRGSLSPTTRISGGTGAAEAWTINSASTSAQGGVLRWQITGTDSRLANTNGNLLGIDTTGTTEIPRYVRLKARRFAKGSDSWEGKLYFESGTNAFTSAKYHVVPEPDWDKGWQWIVWDMAVVTAGSWTGGTVDKLRFDLTQGHATGSTFEIAELIVDDGTQEATEFSSMDLWGQTDAEQAYRDGRYHMASYELRPEIYTLETDVESLVVTRGDKVRVTHDVMAVGYGAARLTQITLNGSGEFISGEMDESFFYKPDKTYQIHIRKGDGEEVSIQLSTLSGESNELKVARDSSGSEIAVAISGTQLAVGDLVLFGESAKNSGEYIVHSITPRQELSASISLVDYNEAVYTEEDIPPFVSNVTTQQLPEISQPPTPRIIEVISDETVMAYTGGVPTPRVLVKSLHTERDINQVPATHIVIEYSKVDENGVAISPWKNAVTSDVSGSLSEISIHDLEVGGLYNLRARTLSNTANTASEWASWALNPHQFVGGSTPPPDVVMSRISVDYVFQWDYPNPPNDLKGFVVKYQGGSDSTWSTGTKAHEGFISTSNFRLRGIIPYGQSTVMVKAVDWFGNESAEASSVSVEIPQESRENIINEIDFSSQVGGTGSYWVDAYPYWVRSTNGTVSGTEIVADVSGSAIFWINETRAFWATTSSTLFWSDTYLDLEVEFEAVTHAASNVPCRVTLDITTEGDSYSVQFSEADYFKDFTLSPPSIEGVYSEFSNWPGELTMTQPPPTLYGVPGGGQEAVGGAYMFIRWRVKILGGRTRPKLQAAKMYVDAPILEEVFSDQSISTASSGIRLVPTLPFKNITSVQVTLRENPAGSFAMFTQVEDIAAFNSGTETGPLIKAYNFGLTAQTANFDAIIRGY